MTRAGKRPRVGVNLLWLVPGDVGGSEAYVTRLLHGVRETGAGDLDLILFALRPFPAAHPDLAGGFESVVAPVSGASRPVRVVAETIWLPRACGAREVDLLHHAGGTVPVASPTPAVLTVHDLQYLTHPEFFTLIKRRYLQAAVPASARQARLVLVPSNYVRRSVVDRLNVREERVRVVPHGIPADERSPRAGEGVRRRYGLGDRPFFLYPAVTWPHKNHPVLVRAMATVARQHPDALLVLTGSSGAGEADLWAEVVSSRVGPRVRRLGRVPAADLDGLYREAVATVFPSRYEGFGAPALEAMRRCCPVVASDATALPEVVDSAGVLLPPDDADAWAKAMCELLEDGDRRDGLVQTGLVRAREFTAERSARLLLEAYAEALT